MESDRTIRHCVAVLGARGVGKTALTTIVSGTGLRESYTPTIEDAHRMGVHMNGILHEITVLDTAGQNEHSVISSSYTVGVDGYVLLFNIANLESFITIQRVHEKLMATLRTRMSERAENVPRALVGNQCDRAETCRQVDPELARRYAKSARIPYVECSALTGYNKTAPFVEIVNTFPQVMSSLSLPATEKKRALEASKSEHRGCVMQ